MTEVVQWLYIVRCQKVTLDLQRISLKVILAAIRTCRGDFLKLEVLKAFLGIWTVDLLQESGWLQEVFSFIYLEHSDFQAHESIKFGKSKQKQRIVLEAV